MEKHDPARWAAGPEVVVTGEFPLPNDDTAAWHARNAVRTTLERWHLLHVIDDVVLAVSELVTNAVRHGLPPILLHIRRQAGKVRVDVEDARPQPLAPAEHPTDIRESGRGLDIVSKVADEAGSEGIPDDGKTVYAAWNV